MKYEYKKQYFFKINNQELQNSNVKIIQKTLRTRSKCVKSKKFGMIRNCDRVQFNAAEHNSQYYRSETGEKKEEEEEK